MFWQLGHHGISTVIKLETLEGKFFGGCWRIHQNILPPLYGNRSLSAFNYEVQCCMTCATLPAVSWVKPTCLVITYSTHVITGCVVGGQPYARWREKTEITRTTARRSL